MIELPITRLREDAVVPERAYAGDAGLDLAACERHELAPGERALVGTGLAVAIPALFAYNYFNGKKEAILMDLERGLTDLLVILKAPHH